MSSTISFLRGQSAHNHSIIEQLQPAYGWLEAYGVQPPRLDRFDELSGWANLKQWPEGRLFGERGEYRWRSTDQGLHLVLIADDAAELCLDKPEAFESSLTESVILWGEWLDPDGDAAANDYPQPVFYASEVPQPQHYPVQKDVTDWNDKLPCLRVRRYRHADLGNFERCLGFGYTNKPAK